MARKTISLPDGLLKLMAEQSQENWSGVAVRAFEARLAEIALRSNGKEVPVDQVIERLMATRLKNLSGSVRRGFADGRAWAQAVADLDQLARLYRLDLRQALQREPQGHLAFMFVQGIDPERCRAETQQDDFWNRYSRGSTPTNEYVKAFEEGARDIVSRVRRRLRQSRRCPGCGGAAAIKSTSRYGLECVGPGQGAPERTICRHRMTCTGGCGERDWHHPDPDDEYADEAG